MRTLRHITLAAILTATTAPAALADGGADCAVCGDPTWPAMESHAPAFAIAADHGEAAIALRADPTWPDTAQASPAVGLRHVSDEHPQLDALNPIVPEETYAIVAGESPERVAKR